MYKTLIFGYIWKIICTYWTEYFCRNFYTSCYLHYIFGENICTINENIHVAIKVWKIFWFWNWRFFRDYMTWNYLSRNYSKRYWASCNMKYNSESYLVWRSHKKSYVRARCFPKQCIDIIFGVASQLDTLSRLPVPSTDVNRTKFWN